MRCCVTEQQAIDGWRYIKWHHPQPHGRLTTCTVCKNMWHANCQTELEWHWMPQTKDVGSPNILDLTDISFSWQGQNPEEYKDGNKYKHLLLRRYQYIGHTATFIVIQMEWVSSEFEPYIWCCPTLGLILLAVLESEYWIERYWNNEEQNWKEDRQGDEVMTMIPVASVNTGIAALSQHPGQTGKQKQQTIC